MKKGVRATLPAALLLATVVGVWLTPTAHGATTAPPVRLSASFTPELLGKDTTLTFGFRIISPGGGVPPPLTTLDLRYPANLGIATSGLGVKSCTQTTLEVLGPPGCPAEALMGYGTATVEIPFGPEVIHETGQITTWMAPIEDERFNLLFYAEGKTPVESTLTLPGDILSAPAPYGGTIDTTIPPLASLPGTAGAVVQLRSTIGPLGITYYRHAHGHTVPYDPTGLLLPSRCPRGGFPFSATFGFLNGSSTVAGTKVPCPRRPTHRQL
jgi:hypothetical protein